MPTPKARDLGDAGVERLALFERQVLGIVDAAREFVAVQDARGGNDWPASGAQPASSTPASCGKSSSILKVQRRGIAQAYGGSMSRQTPNRKIVDEVDPPGWEAPRFAGLVEEDDVADGSRRRASRHIHGWLRGPCSNGMPARASRSTCASRSSHSR